MITLQVLDFPEAEGEKAFHFDREWLAILQATHSLLSLHMQPAPLPGAGALGMRLLAYPPMHLKCVQLP